MRNCLSPRSSKFWLTSFGFAALLYFGGSAFSDSRSQTQNTGHSSYNVTIEEILRCIRLNKRLEEESEEFDRLVYKYDERDRYLANELQGILKNAKSSNFNRCAAAYYLGVMRVPSATGDLAEQITLRFDPPPIGYHLPAIPGDPAADALIKIGNPSIPPLIGNLTESDDAKVREASLVVLYRIDGDKEIVQLRLEKALRKQNDPKKIERLQAAQKALAEKSLAK